MSARKTSALPTRIWRFPARLLSNEDASFAHNLLWRSRDYYNQLVEIERACHGRYVALRREAAPELAALEDAWVALDEEALALIRNVKAARQAEFCRSGRKHRLIEPLDLDELLAGIAEKKKRVTEAAKTHRAAFSAQIEPGRAEHKRRATELAGGPQAGPVLKGRANAEALRTMLNEGMWGKVWESVAQSDEEAHRAHLHARSVCGLPSGTYLQIEDAFARAKKDSLPRPPRFRRFEGEGKLSVQIVGGLTWASMLSGSSSRFSVSPLPSRPGSSPRVQMMLARFDQSIPRGERRLLSFTVRMHREVPSDAVIKWVSLVFRRVGRRQLLELQLTLEHASFAEPKRPAGTRPPEHVQIGWSRVDGGVRVASWPGGEVVVSDAILEQATHAESVEGLADVGYDRIRRLLRRWTVLGGNRFTAWHRMGSDRVREQVRRACRNYAEHVFGGRLGDLWQRWKADRLSRGEDLHQPAAVQRQWLAEQGFISQDCRAAWRCFTWAVKDAHLVQLACDSRRRAVNRRDALLRREAIRIATEYASVTVDGYSIARLKELPLLTMPGERPRDQAQSQAQHAAPGRFREILREVMGPRCTDGERSGGDQKTAGARKRRKVASSGEKASKPYADGEAVE